VANAFPQVEVGSDFPYDADALHIGGPPATPAVPVPPLRLERVAMAAPLLPVPRAGQQALQDSSLARSASEPLLPVSVPAAVTAPVATAASKRALISRAEQPISR
jgi:hypothetical protein